MSPGGDKFVQFLFCFSRYLLCRVTREQGLLCLRYFFHTAYSMKNRHLKHTALVQKN